MKHSDIIEALVYLAPKAEWTLSGDNYNDLIWLSEGNPPTLQEIETEIVLIPAKKAQAKLDQENLRKTAENKLQALGLTSDDLKALGL